MTSIVYLIMSFCSTLCATATTSDADILDGIVPGIEYDPITMVAR